MCRPAMPRFPERSAPTALDCRKNLHQYQAMDGDAGGLGGTVDLTNRRRNETRGFGRASGQLRRSRTDRTKATEVVIAAAC
jgi:hypothetical protein